MERYFNRYRICSYLLVIFCLFHTFGGLLSGGGQGFGADMVWALMKSAQFEIMGSQVSWGGMYLGFGLLFSLFLLFSAFLTWYIGGLDKEEMIILLPVTQALFVTYILVAVISWVYFFAAPGVASSLVALLLGVEVAKQARPRK